VSTLDLIDINLPFAGFLVAGPEDVFALFLFDICLAHFRDF
jgi:hypothetical protein